MHQAIDITPTAQDALSELVSTSSSLYSLPDIYFRVRDIINDPESELSQLSEVLVNDPGLSARLLRIANSPIFGLVARIDTITRAVQVVGLQHIYDLVIATSVTKAFEDIDNEIMNIDSFWIASIERALLARKLAEHIGILDCERLFVAGLLMDIGHLVMYEARPIESRQAIALAEENGMPLHLAERKVLGFSAAELASALASEWQLPEQFRDLILYQDYPELADETRREAYIMHTAKHLAGSSSDTQAIAMSFISLALEAKQELNLEQETIADLLSEALAGIQETLDLILPRSNAA